MESIFSGFPDVDELLVDNYHRLQMAIFEKSYRRIYKELRGDNRTFPLPGALGLLHSALENGLPPKVIKAILNRCPPVSESFSDCHISWLAGEVMKKVIRPDRADVLSLLLEHGASPNRTPDYQCSLLEFALHFLSVKCVKLLMEQPELDTAWPLSLLGWWAEPNDPRPERKACLQAMAPRFTGWDPLSGQPLPIPEPMTLQIIIDAWNVPMLERFCREGRPISQKEGLRAFLQLEGRM